MPLDSRPIEGKQQETGKLAGRSLSACMPDNWSELPTDGDADFGIDYLVQVKDDNDLLQFSFFLQLKGTKSPDLLSDGNFISFQFDVSTLNFYRNQEPAVMVALADLSSADRPKDCSVYYLWLDEDFLDSIKDRREQNEKVSIRIPTSQTITDSLDISQYYLDRLTERDELKEFSRAISKYSSDPLADIGAFREAVESKPGFLDAAKDDSGTPWIVNPEGYIATKLKDIQDHISANRIVAATQLLISIKDSEELTGHEKAELYNLEASIEALNENFSKSKELLFKAKETHDAPRYLINWFEAKLRAEDPPDEEINEFIELLDPSEYRQCFVLSKCLFLRGKFNDAVNAIKEHHPDKKVAILWMSVSIGDNDRVEEIVNTIDIDSLTPKDSYTYHMFVARWKFDKATNGISKRQTHIPSKGIPSFDFEILREVLGCLEKAWKAANQIGYPLDIFLLIDISMLVYSVFNKSAELIEILKNLLIQRPQNDSIRVALAKIYFNSQNFREAARLLSKIKNRDPESLSLLVSAKFDSGERETALNLLIDNLKFLLDHKPQNLDGMLVTGALSARDLLETDKEELLLEHVKGLANGNSLLAIYEYIKKARERPQDIKLHNSKLFEAFNSYGQSLQIASQLFSNLDAFDSQEAEQILEVSKKIRSEREFFEDENIHLAQALTTLKRWSELEELSRRVIERGESSNLWSLFQYASLDEQGKTSGALAILEAPVENESRSVERAERYIGLTMSLGLYEKAESKLKELLNKSVGSHERMQTILGTLIHIYSSSAELHPKLITAIERFGTLVNRDNEEEEGQYLQYFMLLTNRVDLDVEHLIPEFQKRLSRFTERFPESKLLRFAQMSETDSSEDTFEKIRELAGISKERITKWQRDRNLLRNQKLPIPYPLVHHFLDNAQDIFSVWAWGLFSPSNYREYMVRASKRLQDEGTLKVLLSESSPLYLEELSLLVLSELGILDTTCKVIAKIRISRQTYTELSKKSHQIFGSIHSPMAKKIVDVLGKYLDKIELLGSLDLTDRNYMSNNKECLASIQKGLVCTDDQNFCNAFRSLFPDCLFLNTLDIIDLLVLSGDLSADDKTHLIERLCSFPIYQPNLTYKEITDSLFLNLKQLDPDLTSGPFKSVFNRFFPIDQSDEHALDLFSRILANTISNHNINEFKHPLQNLIKTFLVRYPQMGRAQGLASIFVVSCTLMPSKPEHEMIPRSANHALAYELLSEIINVDGSEPNHLAFFSVVSDLIQSMPAETSSELYEKVMLSFIPYSAESDEFAAIYKQKAITVRQKQESPLKKLLSL